MTGDGRKRAIQPVSFNLTDHYERKMYGYALKQQKYFSRYIKRLIMRDMEMQGGNEDMVGKRKGESKEEYLEEWEIIDYEDTVEVDEEDINTFI